MDTKTLLLFFSAHQPRRIKAIENILIGRKTVSNLFWGMQYGLLGYLGTLQPADLAGSSRIVTALVKTADLTKAGPRGYLLTSSGEQRRRHVRADYVMPTAVSLNLRYDLSRFESRFWLATQVVSEYSYHNRNYYPLQLDFLDSAVVKRWFHFQKHHRLVVRYYQETCRFLRSLSQIRPDLAWQATATLVGYHFYGLTRSQVGEQLKRPPLEIKFRQLTIISELVKFILNHPRSVMFGLLTGLRISPVSYSENQTFNLFLRRVPLKRIARIKSLRLSTVCEHLMSVAILRRRRFPFRQVMPDKVLRVLAEVYHGNPETWNFNRIKATGHRISFFYFRMYQIMRSR